MSRLGPLREREFRLLFAGRTISMLGSAMAPVALAFAILNTLHGSATDIGIVLAARQVPVILLLLFGGVWADRLPRHQVMVASNVLSAASQAAAAALLLAGNARLEELAALAAVNGASSAFFFPASTGVIPQTVPMPMLQQANATLRLALNATNITGAAIGGILVAVTSPGSAIAVDAVSYLVAATCIGAMRLPPGLWTEGSTVLQELREGWRDFWSRPWLWAIVLQFGVVNAVVTGAVNVLGPTVAKHHLGGPAAWGAVLTAQSVGLVLCGVLMLRWRPRRILRVATYSVFGLVFVLVALAIPAPLPLAMAGAFLTGFSLEIFGVLWDTTIQQEIPQEKLSRISSYDALGSWVLMPIGFIVAGPVGAAIGTRATFVGATALVVAATALVLLSRDVRTLERRTAPA
ncbi:MAG: MFS transporter [Actinomycetota bacterium]|nr:MFS transporter [Actinomycetota bacterium]